MNNGSKDGGFLPVLKEPLCCRSDEGFQQSKWSQSYFVIINSVPREVWVGSFFAVIWFLTSLSVVLSPLWKEGCSAGWKHHRMSSRDFTFHHGRLLIFISTRRQRSRGRSSPSLTLLSGFWGYSAVLLYCVKVWGDEREQQVISRKQSNVLRIHLLTGCPAASRRRVCWPGSIAHGCIRANYLGWKRKQALLLKRAGTGMFLAGEKKHACPPPP